MKIVNSKTKKILVSGVKPTGDIHFGNYFGAMRQNIDLANSGKYLSYIFIANYHALTTENTKEKAQKLLENTYKLLATYLALGFDIKKSNIFLQSSVPMHTELSTIFNNLVTIPYMMRAHAFKDHEAKNKNVNVGLFTYPILMAADILIYKADMVPVGQDQKQHIEYSRDIAGFFNRAYEKEYFELPKEYVLDNVASIPGIDGEKMSKSKNNHIPIFCDEKELEKKVMSIKTDSLRPEDKKNPDENNIYNIHKYFLAKSEDLLLRKRFEQGGYGYAEAKKDLLKTILKFRNENNKYKKYLELLKNKKKLDLILKAGAKKATEVAKKNIKEIKEIVGLDF